MFGRKARLLADLIGRSNHPNKAKLLGAFNAARGSTKRDVIAHGYLWSNKNTVKFIERSISGEYRAIEHPYSVNGFTLHVKEFYDKSNAFYVALEVGWQEIQDFANAALSLNRKSAKSPGRPTRKR